MCTYVYICYVIYVGKSSLLRALAGLWRVGSGTIYATWYETSRNGRNSDLSGNNNMKFQQVFFLPQKPYNIIGSIRQQIKYPVICPHECTNETNNTRSHTHAHTYTSDNSSNNSTIAGVGDREENYHLIEVRGLYIYLTLNVLYINRLCHPLLYIMNLCICCIFMSLVTLTHLVDHMHLNTPYTYLRQIFYTVLCIILYYTILYVSNICIYIVLYTILCRL